jgi:hypothetical protein
MARGAKNKLTPETQDKICNALRAGNHAKVAAEFGGVSETTFFRWMQEGEAATSGAKREFWEAIKKAEADAEVQRVARIAKAGQDGVWQADAWWLERKFPERWGRQIQDVNHGGTVTVKVKGYGKFTPDEWDKDNE